MPASLSRFGQTGNRQDQLWAFLFLYSGLQFIFTGFQNQNTGPLHWWFMQETRIRLKSGTTTYPLKHYRIVRIEWTLKLGGALWALLASNLRWQIPYPAENAVVVRCHHCTSNGRVFHYKVGFAIANYSRYMFDGRCVLVLMIRGQREIRGFSEQLHFVSWTPSCILSGNLGSQGTQLVKNHCL